VGEVKLARLRHDLIAAVFALEEDDLVRLIARGAELAGFLATEDGNNLLVAYRRAANIVAIEERRDGRNFSAQVDPAHFQLREETALYERLGEVSADLEGFLSEEHFDRAMGRLAALRQPVDEFFERVTVNTDDAALRENRLRLLSRIRAVMNQVADFSQIEG
jgi:glycyl-tRNA synthetase beta chain